MSDPSSGPPLLGQPGLRTSHQTPARNTNKSISWIVNFYRCWSVVFGGKNVATSTFYVLVVCWSVATTWILRRVCVGHLNYGILRIRDWLGYITALHSRQSLSCNKLRSYQSSDRPWFVIYCYCSRVEATSAVCTSAAAVCTLAAAVCPSAAAVCVSAAVVHTSTAATRCHIHCYAS